jgi:tetratricopeptide (TPR) repeat protein
LGDKGAARANVEQALSNARSYLEKEPANRNWRQLLYASLFRIGDLDLDESITRHDRKASERALEEYQASQRIADQLLANDVAHPEGENLAGVDYLAKQRFDLAFAINKLGEAMQVQGNLQGALGQYREALELAKAIENASRMEWKLQSAATRIKIASALRKSKKLDEALQNYSEAIGREEAIFATDPTHKILRSNLASAYENRALLFQERKDYDAAFRGFSDAVRLYAQLNEEDSRDTTWLENLAQVRLKYGTALEEYAKSQNQPLDKAIEQYGAEVAVRDKLAQRAPSNDDWQRQMRESRERLQRVIASAAAPPAKPAAAE